MQCLLDRDILQEKKELVLVDLGKAHWPLAMLSGIFEVIGGPGSRKYWLGEALLTCYKERLGCYPSSDWLVLLFHIPVPTSWQCL